LILGVLFSKVSFHYKVTGLVRTLVVFPTPSPFTDERLFIGLLPAVLRYSTVILVEMAVKRTVTAVVIVTSFITFSRTASALIHQPSPPDCSVHFENGAYSKEFVVEKIGENTYHAHHVLSTANQAGNNHN